MSTGVTPRILGVPVKKLTNWNCCLCLHVRARIQEDAVSALVVLMTTLFVRQSFLQSFTYTSLARPLTQANVKVTPLCDSGQA